MTFQLYDTTDGRAYSQRERALARLGELRAQRSTWVTRWKRLTDVLLPFSGRYFGSNLNQERNRGDRSFGKILDSTASRAVRVLAAGMMSGMTSPARPWFKLALEDEDLNELDSVKIWLEDVAELIRGVFNRGNTYRTLHSMYRELAVFGTAANFVAPNFEKTLWHYPMTIGEFYIGTDELWRVRTCYREFEMSVEQIVNEFVRKSDGSADWSRVSPSIKNLWDGGRGKDKNWPVIHVIEPRPFDDRKGKYGGKNMAFKSCYYELGNENKYEGALRESGFQDFRVIAPRWEVTGSDAYGFGPGFEALGDVLQLQHQTNRKAQAIDHLAHPAIAIPGEAKGREIDILPGGVNPMPLTQGGRVSNLFDVRLDIGAVREDILDIRNRINEAFYVDMFLMIASDPRGSPATAREVAERHEEKLLMLGPVLERLNDEFLSPLIDLAFYDLLRAGKLPPPPEELENHELKIEFISVLAQAQRAVGLASIDRLIGTVAAVSAAKQSLEPWDKIDTDQMLDKYSSMLGVDPSIIVSDDNVAIVRSSRAQAAQQAQAMQMLPELAKAQKTMAETPMDQDSALTRLQGVATSEAATGTPVSSPPGL